MFSKLCSLKTSGTLDKGRGQSTRFMQNTRKAIGGSQKKLHPEQKHALHHSHAIPDSKIQQTHHLKERIVLKLTLDYDRTWSTSALWLAWDISFQRLELQLQLRLSAGI